VARRESPSKGDPDAKAITIADAKKMRRVSLAKRVRLRLGMSQIEFSKAYEIPIGTLRDWEQHRSQPDATAKAYLKVIAQEPDVARNALVA
jgi:putative transcriptional regulator